MIDTVDHRVWFFWPVTLALVGAPTLHRLARHRALGGAVLAMASAALAVVPMLVALPVRCVDDDASLDLRIPALGVGLLGIVAWLAVLARFDGAANSDRRTLLRAAALVPLMLVEFVASSITLAVRCGGTSEPMVWHLGVAAAVLVAAAATGVLGENDGRP